MKTADMWISPWIASGKVDSVKQSLAAAGFRGLGDVGM